MTGSRRFDETMRINAPRGQKVRCRRLYNDLWGGGAPDGALAVGAVYTVKETKVFKSSSLVILAEIPGAAFNSVLFEEVEEILDAVDTPEHLYYRGLEERTGRSR